MGSALTLALAAEEVSRGDASLFQGVAGTILALRPAVLSGNEEVLRHIGPRLARDGGDGYGEGVYRGCFAVHEEPAPGDIMNAALLGTNLATRAARAEEGWTLHGGKVWCPNAGQAGFYCVAAVEDTSRGREGLVLAYCEASDDGIRFLGRRETAGLLSASFGDIKMEGVRVPLSWRAAGPGEDAGILLDNLAFSRLLAAAACVGVAQGAFEEVLDFTSERLAAGKPIRQHSVCACILADIATAVQTGRDAYACAARVFDSSDAGRRSSPAMLSRASLARHHCGRAAVEATNRAMELMGSYGYVTDYHVEKYWRDARTLHLLDVVPQQLKMDIAGGYYRLDPFHPNPVYEKRRRA
jgi:alkylation response protein AidB-like acyl-CoA dehydrogenase